MLPAPVSKEMLLSLPLIKGAIQLTENGWKPAIDETNTMDPFRFFSMCGTAALASRKAALTLISNILSQASSGH